MSTPEPSFAGAAAATRAMFEAPDNPVGATPVEAAPQPTFPVETPVEPGTTPEAPTAPETPPLSWDSLDLSSLPEDQQQYIREHGLRHSDYTRKTQELADQRKQFEQFGDPETVSQAMEFVNNLQDPDFLRQLNADIQTHLDSLGGQPAQTPVNPTQASAPVTQTPGLDPALAREIESLKQWRAEQEHAREEQALVGQLQTKLQTAEDAIRSDYPQYSQGDIDKIYALVPAHNYDLFAAQQQYEDMRKHFTEGLIGTKDQFPAQANSVRSDALVTQPNDMNTMEAAKEATRALYRNAGA